MSDYSNPMNANFGKAVDPVILAVDLTQRGFDVVYLDANPTRLRHADMMRVNTIDMSKLSGKGTRHFAIAIVVNEHEFHTVNKIEWKAIPSVQTIKIDVWR